MRKMTTANAGKTVTFKIPEKEPGSVRNGDTHSLPKTPHPKILQQKQGVSMMESQPDSIRRPQSVPTARKLSPTPQSSRPHSRPSSEQNNVSLETTKKTAVANRTRHHVVKTHHRGVDTVRAISAVRERTNSASRENMRILKYNVVKLRESLLKVEDEIKQMTRGKHALELAVQDIRKTISINQQSVSMQQKKTRDNLNSTMRLLRDESRVLSKSKSQIEQYLRSVKGHLQMLDNIRRVLQTKISTLSESLQLDAQSYKMFKGSREYQSVFTAPITQNSYRTEEATAPICSRVVELVSGSKKIRTGIEGLIVSMQTQRMQAHNTVTTSTAQRVQEANSRKREMLLERGQMRLSQNSANHQQHVEDITLGRVLGPISDKHRSVSEKVDRPLSRRRPGSSTEERAQLKRTTSKLAKRLSASALQVTEIGEADQHLTRQLKQHEASVSLDSITLRIRKMSLDNRWVQ